MQLGAVVAAACALAGCSTSSSYSSFDPKTGTSASPRVVGLDQRVPKGGGVYKLGNPYKVSGRWFVPREEPGYDRVGIASWYGDDFHGRRTANGEIFDMRALTAAHQTLPLPSYAYVTNLENGRTILVRVNDRGPFVGNRIIDLSQASARALGYHGQGLTRVRIRYAGPAPLNGNDERERRYLAGLDRDDSRYRAASEPAYQPRYPARYDETPPVPQAPVRQQTAWDNAPYQMGWSPLAYRSRNVQR